MCPCSQKRLSKRNKKTRQSLLALGFLCYCYYKSIYHTLLAVCVCGLFISYLFVTCQTVLSGDLICVCACMSEGLVISATMMCACGHVSVCHWGVEEGHWHPGWQWDGVVESDGKEVTGPRSHIRMESNKWGNKCHRFPNFLLICKFSVKFQASG